MNSNLFAYLKLLELIAFFSAYPLVYAVTYFIADIPMVKKNLLLKPVALLPAAYALVGTLYLGLQLKTVSEDFSFHKVQLVMQHPWLVGWGLLSVLFWMPVLRQKPMLSLLHSLVFFSFLLRDFFTQMLPSSPGNDLIRNDMKLYTVSIVLNFASLCVVMLFSFLLSRHDTKRP